MSNDNKKIVILRKPHTSTMNAPEGYKIETLHSYRETYSFPDLRLLSSIKVENRN